MDRDLQSIQEVRNLVARARTAAAQLATFSQEQLDAICAAVASACEKETERLARMAVEETGFGRWEDKVLKNQLGSTIVWNHIKNKRVVGILHDDTARKVIEIGVPMGVVAALIPSTNPTSTTMYKCLIALKSGNAIVISPHPGAKRCITETFRIIEQAARQAGAPDGAVTCVELTTMEATNALLKHRDVSIILATGGEAMVRAAYSSGNPALGVGPGNGPSFIEKSADIPLPYDAFLPARPLITAPSALPSNPSWWSAARKPQWWPPAPSREATSSRTRKAAGWPPSCCAPTAP